MERIEKILVRAAKIFSLEEARVVESFPCIAEFMKSWVEGAVEKKKARLSQFFTTDILDRCAKLCERSDIHILFFEEEGFPPLLREIDQPPLVLFVKGNQQVLSGPELRIACVGSRKPSAYGKIVVHKIVKALAEKGTIIVSGLAYGIDVLSHLEALENATATVGVLGCGVDVVYPAENEYAFQKVIQNGCIVSEYFPWQKPEVYFFPERNRIISGLSQGVLVLEASMKSGSLITARFAIEQNRDVFAVPGSILNPLSEGTNGLIKKGAKVVTDAADIFEEYPWLISTHGTKEENPTLSSQTLEEQAIYTLILQGIDQFDPLMDRTEYSSSDLNRILTTLSLKGFVVSMGSQYVPIKRPIP